MIQRLLDWGKFNSPSLFALATLLIGAEKWFFVNRTLNGYALPSEAMDVAIGGLGALLGVRGLGSTSGKVAVARASGLLPVWAEAPLAKFLAEFKLKSPKAWLLLSIIALAAYAAVKYSLTTSWTLPKLVVDFVLTAVPFFLSAHTTGIIQLSKTK